MSDQGDRAALEVRALLQGLLMGTVLHTRATIDQKMKDGEYLPYFHVLVDGHRIKVNLTIEPTPEE